MEKVKEFILKFLNKESECWNRLHSNELDAFNQEVREFRSMAIEGVEKGLGISERTDFGIFTRTEKEIADNPITYKPRHLYKLSAYKNEIYGDIWVAYVSSTTTDSDPKAYTIFEAFMISEIEDELRIIGTMIKYKNRSTMKVEGWKASVYNPSDLDIKKLGEFIETERYLEPGNRDGFSLDEYLKDK
ncbi:hypothetical protein SAMN05443633_104350 [Chryseobacterium arachidis]|uniref:Uncharacterized protein n=1 Tax=Chryseobacterium arachidis TaxID=1416778 RepID=A0A1M5C0J0_9FLAO|nr:hypothetical protein [Chryseobacterium arachidis]SHF47962.1 hypothetical protein SAMN05443633_104350 [Chryseobacterium arachidis]